MAQAIIPEEKPIGSTGSATASGSEPGIAATNGTGSTPQTTTKTSPVENLLTVFKSSIPRSAWFFANLFVVFHTVLYLFSWKSGGWLNKTWYRFIFINALASFGIVTYESLGQYKSQTGSIVYGALLSDDNAHYFYDALIWLILPKQSLATAPFYIFSFFHVLSFSSTQILPAINAPKSISSQVSDFAKQYHDLSRRLASTFELLLFVFLVLQSILFYKGSWISLILYSIFIKVKTERSVFTRNTLKNWEVRIDGIVSAQNIPPVVKAQWGNLKRFIKQLGSFSLVHEVEVKTDKTN